jgi:Na+/H+-dicarboxylate symporter
MLRPPVTPLPDETAAAIPALASPLAAAGFDVESVAPASGTDVPVDELETGAFVTGACVATAVPRSTGDSALSMELVRRERCFLLIQATVQ